MPIDNISQKIPQNKNGNSKFHALNGVIRNPTISPAARMLYAILWSYADGNGICWPSTKVLAQDAGYTEREIAKLLQELIKKGAITKKRRGKTLTNIYSVIGTVVPISNQNCGSPHKKSDQNCGSGVIGTVVHSDRNSGSLKNTPPAYCPNGYSEPNISINRPIEHINTSSSCDENEKKFLDVLRNIQHYPFNKEKDSSYYRQLKELYPNLDILSEAKKWAVYKLDQPLKAKSNARSQFRRWCEKATEWHQQQGNEPNKPSNDFSSIDFSSFLWRSDGLDEDEEEESE